MATAALRFSTLPFSDGARLPLWEAWNDRALLGIRCQTRDGGGFHAAETNLHLPRVDVALVQADRHSATRSADLIERQPSDAIVVYLPLRGQSVVRDRLRDGVATPGRALVLSAEVPFQRHFPTPFTELVLKVSRSALETAFGSATGAARLSPLKGLSGLRTKLLWQAMSEAADRPAAMPTENLEQVTSELLASLFSAGGDPTVPADRLALSSMLIDRDFREPSLSLSRVSHCLGISERQLSRTYAAQGTTFPREVMRRRIDHALHLLATTAQPVSAVAQSCGFTSASYFCRAFRDHTNRTPLAHRRA